MTYFRSSFHFVLSFSFSVLDIFPSNFASSHFLFSLLLFDVLFSPSFLHAQYISSFLFHSRRPISFTVFILQLLPFHPSFSPWPGLSQLSVLLFLHSTLHFSLHLHPTLRLLATNILLSSHSLSHIPHFSSSFSSSSHTQSSRSSPSCLSHAQQNIFNLTISLPGRSAFDRYHNV